MGLKNQIADSSLPASSITEDTPLLVSIKTTPKSLSSLPKTFANVFIAIVGAGVLGLPYTFMRTGWLISLLMILFVAALTYHCMMLLVYTRRKLDEDDKNGDNGVKIASFGDLGYVVCGSLGRFSVDFMIVLSQAGFCVGYLIFIANTLPNVFDFNKGVIGSKSFYIWTCFPFQLGLNSIPSLTHLAPLSIFADIVDLGAMGVVMVKDVLIFMNKMPEVETFGTLSTFFYGLGVAVYSFEGIGMALPLESEMKDKSKFGKVLALAMLFIAAMYGGFGLLGYFAFGSQTKDIITGNMGQGLVSTLVQLGLAINLFFTFPLMMNPVYEVFERRFWRGRYCLWMRWILVLGVCLIALFVPNFADFLSLVGSSTCCVLGFVLPSLFHCLTFKDEMTRTQAFADLGIVVLGCFLGVSGTWYSLVEIFSEKV